MPSGWRPGFSACAAIALIAAGLAAKAVAAELAPPPDLPLRLGPDGAAAPGQKRKANAGLPPLRPYRGAERRGLRGGPAEAGTSGPAPSVAALPTPPPRRRIPVEDNSYDPLGERIGNLRLTPYVEEDVGWSSNPASTAGAAKASAFATTEVGAALQSDWSRNDVHGQVKAGYTDYFATPQASGPYGAGNLDGRYDISRDIAVDAQARFSLTQEPLSSLGVTSGAANSLTTLAAYGATLGATRNFGALALGLHGTFDHLSYEGADATGAENFAADDYNDWGLKARASLRLSEAVAPFLELGVDARRYLSQIDSAGYRADSDGVAALIGVSIAYSQKLTGEASLGYGERRYQDPRLPGASAPLVNASLIWSATPLTTVTLKAQSAIADAVIAGASADIQHGYTLDVSHALTRQIALGVSAGYATDAYVGVPQRDSTTTLGLKGEYHLNREVVLKASATRQQLVSSVAGSNYVGDVFMLGVRLQR